MPHTHHVPKLVEVDAWVECTAAEAKCLHRLFGEVVEALSGISRAIHGLQQSCKSCFDVLVLAGRLDVDAPPHWRVEVRTTDVVEAEHSPIFLSK